MRPKGNINNLNRSVVAEYVTIVFTLLKDQGIRATVQAIKRKLHILKLETIKPEERLVLDTILSTHADEPIVIFPPLVNWHIPLYQRPQHIALRLAQHGFLYFYCTDNSRYDQVQGYEQVRGSMYLTNRCQQLLDRCSGRIIHLYSSDNRTTWDFVDQELKRGTLILYEYIDEIHDQVSGFTIPAHTREKHEKILRDERCMVVATADKLQRDVLHYRSKNCVMVTNGVDYEHFSAEFSADVMPVEMRPIVAGRPVIGYFGALASWFDYELVLRVARERPHYEIVLIGWDYDHSLASYPFEAVPNLHVIGPIAYHELPRYAYWFDVATIPFRINEVTESTSPIKLFEYMALAKPIVTTGLPECRNYRSVLIGEDHDDFIAKLDLALTLRDDEAYKAILTMEALENTWEAKASAIAQLIRENMSATGACPGNQ